MNIQQQNILGTEIQLAAYASDLASRDFATVASALNDREVIANPTSQGQTPVQFTWSMFLALLSPAEILGLYEYGELAGDMKDALIANDRIVLASLWRAVKSLMPAGTVTAVETAFAATEPDPLWSATVALLSRAQELGLPTVTAQDVESVWQRLAGE